MKFLELAAEQHETNSTETIDCLTIGKKDNDVCFATLNPDFNLYNKIGVLSVDYEALKLAEQA